MTAPRLFLTGPPELVQPALADLRAELPGLVAAVASPAALLRCCAAGDVEVAVVAVPADPGAPCPWATLERLAAVAPGVGRLLLLGARDFDRLQRGMRVGADDAVALPVPAGAWAAAVQRARAAGQRRTGAAGPAGAPPPGRLLAVWSARGGAGKTLVSAGLALAAHGLRRGRVLLVDLDLQFGGAAAHLGLQPERSLADLLPVVGELEADHLEGALALHPTGLPVLCGGAGPAAAAVVTGAQTGAVLAAYRQRYDLVVADLPSWLGPAALAALAAADAVLYVVTPDAPAVQSLVLALPRLAAAGVPVRERLGLVVNRTSVRADLQPAEIATLVSLPLLGQVRAGFWQLQGALTAGGSPLAPGGRSHPVGADLLRLANVVTG